ncbi:transcriptional regulator with GAF, ATPase, and Fis domain [Desulfosalsimonas propionicica]|uniref:Transcriptional regulator with GAF, ATPase, and Fis domain n=1 Tax=Desulfosalsimonas propionicica TaxID=332175 RepID=A0A7W0HJM0_9BACT|nr:sigma 54-interacting transcriptional regulator [Desulfosalsimonas propionicica]MBA2880369.1 transcriptional regulator with GAF, ATPase, and Fis domain [Desulfosalsimonas propionicica]
MSCKTFFPESDKASGCEAILSLAALFEGEFNIDWLQDLSGHKASAIFAALDWGVEKKWLARSSPGDFYFLDYQVQQEFRAQLPFEQSKRLHGHIAEMLSRNLVRGRDKTLRVAWHLLHVANDHDGCRVLIENGDIHRRQFQDEQARHYYDKAIEDLRRIPGPEADALFVKATLQYARVSTDSDNPARVIDILKEAIARAEAIGSQQSAGFLRMHLGKSEWLRSRYQPALDHFQSGWELTRSIDDPSIQKSVSIFGMFYHYWSGRYRDVVGIYETLVPDVEDRFPKGRLPLLAALTAGVCLGHTGLYSQALGMLHAIREHGRSLGNLSISGLAGVSMGYLLLELHRPEDAIETINNSWEEIEKSKSLYARLGGLALLGYGYHLAGRSDKAVSCIRQYLDDSRKSAMTVKYSAVMLLIGQAAAEGTFPRMEGLDLDEEIRYSIESGNLLMRGVACRHKALMLRNSGFSGKPVLDLISRSISDLETCGHRIERARSMVEAAREYIRMGDEKMAMEYAQPAARELFSFNETLVPDDIRPLVRNLRYGESLLEEILQLSQELTSIRDFRALLRRIISAANRITGAERGAIFIPEDQYRRKPVLKAAKNLTTKDVTGDDFRPSMRVIGQTVETGRGRIMELDTTNSDRPATGSAIRSCICVPLKIRNQLIGVLYHDNRLFRSAFKETDLEVLQYFAAQAAIAMDNAEAWETLRGLYEQKQLEKEHYEKEYLETIHFDDFVGKSPAIQAVFRQARQAAPTDTTVLIFGQTGVGKELVARSIHRHSLRSDKPFIRVHCSALPENLIASELFGHEKGAFTGAVSRQIGRFELANGGTLFLDEIGDISMEVQVKLLRVLQSHEFERVGGSRVLKSDFRLIAATNRDLAREVEAGRFRRDLYYRLNVFPIQVPRLCRRKEDIPLLAEYFLGVYANKCNKNLETIPSMEMEKLMAYDWPGNVRELENVIERGVILSSGSFYQVPDLGKDHAPPDPEMVTLRENERRHILRVLAQTRGKVAGAGGAAEILDIHPNTLFSRMKKLGISRKSTFAAETKPGPAFLADTGEGANS